MIDIGIVGRFKTDSNLYFSQTLWPLLRWRSMLRDAGIRLRFSSQVNGDIRDCRYVFMFDTVTDPIDIPPEEEKQFTTLRNSGCAVIYFDNADSCGTTSFQVMPFVHLYVRRQIYRDMMQYLRVFTGLRSYTQYYHDRFGVQERFEERRLALRAADIKKIMVGWNSGMGNYALTNRLLRRFNYENCARAFIFPFFFSSDIRDLIIPSRPLPWASRRYDIHYRAVTRFTVDTITFGREKVNELLEEFSAESMYALCFKGTVSRRAYHEEMRRAKIVISPFGYGEICHRDFEGFLNGCCVVKPSMAHLETWPDYYRPMETYIDYAWDFSDFKERIAEALSSNKAQEIAAYGHELFNKFISPAGGAQFCGRFMHILKSAETMQRHES